MMTLRRLAEMVEARERELGRPLSPEEMEREFGARAREIVVYEITKAIEKGEEQTTLDSSRGFRRR